MAKFLTELPEILGYSATYSNPGNPTTPVSTGFFAGGTQGPWLYNPDKMVPTPRAKPPPPMPGPKPPTTSWVDPDPKPPKTHWKPKPPDHPGRKADFISAYRLYSTKHRKSRKKQPRKKINLKKRSFRKKTKKSKRKSKRS